MNNILDQSPLRFAYSHKAKNLAKENSWEVIVKQYNDHFVKAEDSLKMVKENTDGYKKIVDYIHKIGSVTKKQLLEYIGWGRGIPFNIYRNRLRTEPTIKLTKYGYEKV